MCVYSKDAVGYLIMADYDMGHGQMEYCGSRAKILLNIFQ